MSQWMPSSTPTDGKEYCCKKYSIVWKWFNGFSMFSSSSSLNGCLFFGEKRMRPTIFARRLFLVVGNKKENVCSTRPWFGKKLIIFQEEKIDNFEKCVLIFHDDVDNNAKHMSQLSKSSQEFVHFSLILFEWTMKNIFKSLRNKNPLDIFHTKHFVWVSAR